MTRNLPSLKEIASGRTLTDLSLDALDALLSEAETENKLISAAKRAITAHIETIYAGLINQAYSLENKDFGTVHVRDGSYDIEITTPKKVEWSQDQLAAAAHRIAAEGDDPTEYLAVTYTVPEKNYAAWPASIRAVFEPARTVKPGSRTLKLVRKEAA